MALRNRQWDSSTRRPRRWVSTSNKQSHIPPGKMRPSSPSASYRTVQDARQQRPGVLRNYGTTRSNWNHTSAPTLPLHTQNSMDRSQRPSCPAKRLISPLLLHSDGTIGSSITIRYMVIQSTRRSLADGSDLPSI